MSIEVMQSYKVTCDVKGCKTYIHLSARREPDELIKVLRHHRWWVSDPSEIKLPVRVVHCPEHAKVEV